jgi:hypothetical protein
MVRRVLVIAALIAVVLAGARWVLTNIEQDRCRDRGNHWNDLTESCKSETTRSSERGVRLATVVELHALNT